MQQQCHVAMLTLVGMGLALVDFTRGGQVTAGPHFGAEMDLKIPVNRNFGSSY